MANSMISWVKNWNGIIREVLFADEELKKLMLIPEGTNVLTFVKNYFIRAGYTNLTVRDEKVRIVYGDMRSEDIGAPNIRRQEMGFDIYVKEEYLHNAEADRLLMRTHLIANRIIELLTKERYVHGYRFWMGGDTDMGTTVTGYARYHVSLFYMKVY